MPPIEATLVGLAVIGFAIRLFAPGGRRGIVLSLAAASLIIPGMVLYGEFFVPYQGGGASMWPLAILFGGAYGAASAAFGCGLGEGFVQLREHFR